jgi:hypothetical protein
MINDKQKQHGKIYWWFWAHFTREGRDLLQFIRDGGTLNDCDIAI